MVATTKYATTSQEGFGFIDMLGNGDISVEQVDLAMKQMDQKFHTQFYSWIRNENNVDYISYYLRRVITEYEQEKFPAIKRAIQWLVEGWSVQRTAELLIKLFYHWGIGDAKFAGLVLQITKQWQVQPQIVDLVITLVIGERSSKTARFLHHLTNDWPGCKLTDLVGAIALRLRWTERYCKHFLLQFACLGDQAWEHKRLLVNDIRQQFSQRRIALSTPDSLISFTLHILNMIISTPVNLNSSVVVSPSNIRTPRIRNLPPALITSSSPTRRITAPNTPYITTTIPDDDNNPTPQPSPCPSTSKILIIP